MTPSRRIARGKKVRRHAVPLKNRCRATCSRGSRLAPERVVDLREAGPVLSSFQRENRPGNSRPSEIGALEAAALRGGATG